MELSIKWPLSFGFKKTVARLLEKKKVDYIIEIMAEDLHQRKSAASIWKLEEKKPQIKQIYGHYLPPYHREIVRNSQVSKDYNFPPPRHDGRNAYELKDLLRIGEELSSNKELLISINSEINIRSEYPGAVIYTPHFNGYYVNEIGNKILMSCKEKKAIKDIVSLSGCKFSTIREFIARALTLGIVDVQSTNIPQ